MAHLVTGYAGTAHIKSADDGAFNASFFGDGQYVMEVGNCFKGSILNNNTVRILDGNGLMYGRHFRIEPNAYEDVTIATGTAGKNRCDLICATYSKTESTGIESLYLQVVKGTETTGTATLPKHTDGNILEGATFNQMPLYKVTINGVVLSKLTPLFETIPTYKALAEKYAQQFEKTITALQDENIIDSMEEIEANTRSKMFSGALALKELAGDVLPLTGGTLTGNLTVKKADSGTAQMIAENSLRKGGILSSNTGNFGLYDSSNSKWLAKSDADGNVSYAEGSVGSVYTVTSPGYSALGVAAGDTTAYLKAWLKWFCANHTSINQSIITVIQPSAFGQMFVNIYNTDNVNSEGLPQYCSGLYIPLEATPKSIYRFGTYDYSFSVNALT